MAEVDTVSLDTELLSQLEEEACSRYTQEDAGFIEHCNKGIPKPPILPAERFDHNRQRRVNYRHQDHRRGGHFRDHRRDYRDHRQGNFGSNSRNYDYDRRHYRTERANDDCYKGDHETSKHHPGSSY